MASSRRRAQAIPAPPTDRRSYHRNWAVKGGALLAGIATSVALLGVSAAVSAGMGVSVASSAALTIRATVARGQALFTGAAPLTARLRGHPGVLPAAVLACVNCHGATSRGPVATAAAPRLEAAFLLEARTRRGGPASAYDLASFCKTLRTGVDPAHILVAREMPLYEIDDVKCAELWRFLTVAAADSNTAAAPQRTPSPILPKRR